MDIRGGDGAAAQSNMERVHVEEEVAVISRTSAIPIHTQFRAHLLRRIERGDLRQGQKLPSEREYADQLGVSLAPIRQAILDLVIRIRFRGLVTADAVIGEALRTRERKLLLIRRLAWVNGQPAALLDAYL